MTTTTPKKKITISLSDALPIRIVDDDWPIIASGWDHDGKVACQANLEWSIRVRRHADGRTIVYGVLESGPGGQPIGWHDKRVGYRLAADAGEDETIRAIRRVAGAIRDNELADRVIASLPAVELE
jgi:hypothetical protein